MNVVESKATAIGCMILSLCCLGSWPAILTLLERRGRLPQHTFLDFTTANLLPTIVIAFLLGEVRKSTFRTPDFTTQLPQAWSLLLEIHYLRNLQDNWPSVLLAVAGGVLLSVGNLATQYAFAFVGLSVTELITTSITVVIGCFLIAVFLGTAVHSSNAADVKAKLESLPREYKAGTESPGYRVYKSGRIERLIGESIVPPSLTPQNGVVSKDVVYSPGKNLSLRIYLPEKVVETGKKLPILVYFHGGGFIIETAFSPTYHTFLTSAVVAADCLAISVDYRRAPEFPIPIPYEDSWDSLKWVFAHISGSGQENWLNKHADFSKVFLAGDSAGGNIAHHLTTRAKREKLDSIINGIILIHPYFWGKTPIDELETRDVMWRKRIEGSWRIASPNSENGADDPMINVVGSKSSDLSGLGCGRVLVMVAGDDHLVRQGLGYAAKLEKSEWKGEVEVMETENESHVFHLKNPNTDNARKLVKKFAEFINK